MKHIIINALILLSVLSAAGQTGTVVFNYDEAGNQTERYSTPFYIYQHPQSIEILAGSSGSLTIGASGNNLSYQWRRNGAAVPGTAATLSASEEGTYTCVVNSTDEPKMLVSGKAIVKYKFGILKHPQSIEVCAGTTVTLSTSASLATGYQWQKDGVNIVGATGSTYSVPVSAALSADYRCVVSGSNNATAVSNPARVTIYSPSQAGNIVMTNSAGGFISNVDVGNTVKFKLSTQTGVIKNLIYSDPLQNTVQVNSTSLVFYEEGEYEIYATVQNGVCPSVNSPSRGFFVRNKNTKGGGEVFEAERFTADTIDLQQSSSKQKKTAIIAERSLADAELAVSPNPSQGRFTVSYTSEETGTGRITLRNASGLVVESLPVVKEGNNFSYTFEMEGRLPEGIYFVELLINAARQTAKIVIVK